VSGLARFMSERAGCHRTECEKGKPHQREERGELEGDGGGFKADRKFEGPFTTLAHA